QCPPKRHPKHFQIHESQYSHSITSLSRNSLNIRPGILPQTIALRLSQLAELLRITIRIVCLRQADRIQNASFEQEARELDSLHRDPVIRVDKVAALPTDVSNSRIIRDDRTRDADIVA